MVTVCQECQEVINVDLKGHSGLSHGLCKHCQPAYLRRNGVPEKDIEEMMKKYVDTDK